MIRKIKSRWIEEGGYREVLKIAFPLILSTGSWSLQHFVDRMFLTWHSPQAIAASMPSGMANWTLVSLFVGIAAYVNTFVAQYYGAKRSRRIGPAVWQGIYLSLVTMVLAIPAYFLAERLFSFFNHDAEVLRLEVLYFQILLFGAPFVVVNNAISGFFSGLGRTWTVMWVNILATGINMVLDYLIIFGRFGFPEMGMAGAAWATVIAMVVSTIVFALLMGSAQNNREYHTLSGWRFDPDLFRRLIRYGFPNGVQFVLEILAFTIFIFLIGEIGLVELAASNIAFNINMLAFLPMYGLTIGISILVGQRLGENNEALAERTTWSAFHLGFAFFSTLGLGYFLVPGLFIWPFAAQADPAEFEKIRQLTVILLKFVAFYCLFDAGNMIFSGALKGAGDTRFVAIASVVLSWAVMLIPSLLVVYFFNGHLYWLWVSVTLYVVGLCLAFYWRFQQGGWKAMRVIEPEEPPRAVGVERVELAKEPR
jgi:MATE family multidrug resistance protein